MENCSEKGIVSAVRDDGTAEVNMIRTHDCGGCKACIFATKGDITLPARNSLGARVGDRVEVSVPKGGTVGLAATGIALGIPLVLMIASVLICSFAKLEEWINLVVSFCVLALGFCAVFAVERIIRKSKMSAEIVAIEVANADEIEENGLSAAEVAAEEREV